jgi:hypothetical protein
MFTTTARRFRLPAISGAAMLALALAAPSAVAGPSAQSRVREQLGEIGAWAVPSTSKQQPLVGESRQTIVREKLGEIGAWAVPSTSKESPLRSEKLDGLNLSAPTTRLGEIGAWAVPSTTKEVPLRSEKLDGLNFSVPTTRLASNSEGFEWGDAAIGAGTAAALFAAAAALVGVRRRISPAS